MEPGSQSVSASERSSNRAADIVGVIIALLTLIAPLAVIAHYSGEAERSSASGYVRPAVPNR